MAEPGKANAPLDGGVASSMHYGDYVYIQNEKFNGPIQSSG